MGNCLVIQQDREEIKIMGVGGELMQLKFAGDDDAASASAGVGALPAADVGRLYHLFPPAPKAAAADPGVMRVKLVISKQELKRMLDKETFSMDDMAALVRKEAAAPASESDGGEHEHYCCRSPWQPALASIPEGSDLY